MRAAFAIGILCAAAAWGQQNCTFTLTPSSANVSSGGGTQASVNIAASSPGCARPGAVSTVPWIIVVFGNGAATGSGSFGYRVDANLSAQPRTGTVTVGTAIFQVTQSGAPCIERLEPASFAALHTGGSGSFIPATNTSTCSWVASSGATWIAITGGAAGTGNVPVSFSVAPNTLPALRTGSIAIGNQTFTITQDGIPCNFTFAPPGAAPTAAGGPGTFAVSATAGCAWRAAVAGFPWISILPPDSGSGNGAVSYTVAASTLGVPRTGAITVGGQAFAITQAAASCAFTLSPGTLSVPAAGGTATFNVTTPCSWSPTSNVPWLTVTSAAPVTGNGTVALSVAPNPASEARSGSIAVGTVTVLVTQAGLSCNYAIAPAAASALPTGGSGSISVTAAAGCPWSAASGVSWMRVTPGSGSGAGSVSYTVDANAGSTPRTGTLTVAGLTFTMSQSGTGTGIRITSAGVVNAASYAGGVVAPGQIVTIYGAGMGPAALATLELTSDGGAVSTLLKGTRVLFDGVPAPMVYTSEGQLSAIVPYAVAGKASTQVQVEYNSARSNVAPLPVAAAAPGLFTLDSSGRGPVAALTPDYAVVTAANAAPRGSVVLIFGTGEGQTTPAGVDGKLTDPAVLPRAQRVSVRIGGLDAKVLYAGGAPFLVAGLLQINVEVPAGVAPGDAAVTVRVGDFESQAGVTLAVK